MKQQYIAYLYKRNHVGSYDLAEIASKSEARRYRKHGYRDTTEERFAQMWVER